MGHQLDLVVDRVGPAACGDEHLDVGDGVFFFEIVIEPRDELVPSRGIVFVVEETVGLEGGIAAFAGAALENDIVVLINRGGAVRSAEHEPHARWIAVVGDDIARYGDTHSPASQDAFRELREHCIIMNIKILNERGFGDLRDVREIDHGSLIRRHDLPGRGIFPVELGEILVNGINENGISIGHGVRAKIRQNPVTRKNCNPSEHDDRNDDLEYKEHFSAFISSAAIIHSLTISNWRIIRK